MTDISESYLRRLKWCEAKRELQRFGDAKGGIILDEKTDLIVLVALGYTPLETIEIMTHQHTIRKY